jgi:hypothetical protein
MSLWLYGEGLVSKHKARPCRTGRSPHCIPQWNAFMTTKGATPLPPADDSLAMRSVPELD